MTPILEVATNYGTAYIDDERLDQLLDNDPPLYSYELWRYLRAGIPLFSLPSEMPVFLLGTPENPHVIEPCYIDKDVSVEENYTKSFSLIFPEAKGFDVCSARVRENVSERTKIRRVKTSFDAKSGTVTVFADEKQPILSGSSLNVDFYLDGFFVKTLSAEVMAILGLCMQVAWQEKFNTDWLSLVSKVEDKSFSEQNRANKENADTARLHSLTSKLAGRMRRFEANLYRRRMHQSNPLE